MDEPESESEPEYIRVDDESWHEHPLPATTRWPLRAPEGNRPMSEPIWFKSSYSQENTAYNCVETARMPAGMGVRDSKNPDGPAFDFSSQAWRDMLGTLKRIAEA
jgi:hypothetical protein